MAEYDIGEPDSESWSIEEIPFQAIDLAAVHDDTQLFHIVATASFVEITSDIYTRNLITFFNDDDEVVSWLRDTWERDELRHGATLRRYVKTAWPDFDWDATYRAFFAEFRPLCSLEQLCATRALEMAARCVVETGTAIFYRMLAEISPEPVLRQIALLIRADEVRHYKYFYRYFRRYHDTEQPSRAAVVRTLWNRIGVIDDEDAYTAFKHIYSVCNPDRPFQHQDYVRFRDGFRQLAKHHLAYDSAIKMLLKPLQLNTTVERVARPALAAATRLMFMR